MTGRHGVFAGKRGTSTSCWSSTLGGEHEGESRSSVASNQTYQASNFLKGRPQIMKYTTAALSATFAVLAASLVGWSVAGEDDGNAEHEGSKGPHAFTLSSPDVPSRSFFATKFIL